MNITQGEVLLLKHASLGALSRRSLQKTRDEGKFEGIPLFELEDIYVVDTSPRQPMDNLL